MRLKPRFKRRTQNPLFPALVARKKRAGLASKATATLAKARAR